MGKSSIFAEKLIFIVGLDFMMKRIRITESELKTAINSVVRQVLSEMAKDNLPFGEFKKDMETLGYGRKKLTRGSAWMFKLLEPYNNQTGSIQVDAHDDNSPIDGNTLRRVAKTLNGIGWFNDPNNYSLFPFDKWQVPRKNIYVDTTQQEIEEANEKYKDAEVARVFYKTDNPLCVINVNGKYNLCRSINDRRPLLSDWFDEFGYDNKTHTKLCLKRHNWEIVQTEAYPINTDGTLDIEEMIIENKRYEKKSII